MGCRAGSRGSLYYKDMHFLQNLVPSVNKTFFREISTKRYTEIERAKERGKRQRQKERLSKKGKENLAN